MPNKAPVAATKGAAGSKASPAAKGAAKPDKK
jgi:hypothetical protein